MIVLCQCGREMSWEIQRVGTVAMLMTKCWHCTPAAGWHHEPVEIIRKPAGKAELWPAQTDAPTVI